MDVPSTLGLRARNKAAKRAAISRAAAELFAAHGYAGTTTQQVARAADVAEGTVFRYASSKPELLLMVINEHLRPLVESASDLPDGAAPDEAVLGILDPIIDLAHDQPDNAAPFLREVLFGEDGPQRSESLEIVAELRGRIAAVVAPYGGRGDGVDVEVGPRNVQGSRSFGGRFEGVGVEVGPQPVQGSRPLGGQFEGMGLEEVASWLFSTVVTELLREVVGLGSSDPRAVLRARVRVLLRGLGIPVGP
ncbi:TetR/AcrR family transcriptional regulator [Tessaracoccus palaemonis]|uniref:TetR/AcrR family transcriptional regulator n=1 Tax=Tessaracoccus palaemonis TaxID=2829499 RepID=A0ABX8SP55_9ACTN|nr:TetR/AcrR family transcriptional regulator [Tessaracoccus palaemonis]QXT62999.1 TetR/AcrR family transcriptional regulator [Tessaracoccus palaemonis]